MCEHWLRAGQPAPCLFVVVFLIKKFKATIRIEHSRHACSIIPLFHDSRFRLKDSISDRLGAAGFLDDEGKV